jgi:Glyoxalase-like domain
LLLPKDGSRRRILLIRAPDEKLNKNRIHFDLRPDDQAAEVERLEGLGAKRIDIGQGDDVSWVVMADPEGNEFCVLRALEADEDVDWGD